MLPRPLRLASRSSPRLPCLPKPYSRPVELGNMNFDSAHDSQSNGVDSAATVLIAEVGQHISHGSPDNMFVRSRALTHESSVTLPNKQLDLLNTWEWNALFACCFKGGGAASNCGGARVGGRPLSSDLSMQYGTCMIRKGPCTSHHVGSVEVEYGGLLTVKSTQFPCQAGETVCL